MRVLNTITDLSVFNKSLDLKIHTNVYGLGRSCIALSLILSLTLTKSFVYFPTSSFEFLATSNNFVPNFFLMFGQENLSIAITVACFILLSVISGYLPQLTGILHAWLSYSFFTGALMIEGGDQLAQIICILLIPVTLLDRRINHWHTHDFFKYNRPQWVDFFGFSCLAVIQIQMAIVYFFAVADKVAVSQWIDGSAVYYWFNHVPFGADEPLNWLLGPIVGNPYITPFLTWGVLVTEALLFGALFMNQKHKLIIFKLGVTFHFFIIIVHGLWSFFFVMLGVLIIYLIPRGKELKIQYKLPWIK